jgi:hypothetical protein
MAITCPRCGAGFDVTLFQFGHRVRCGCGAEIEYPGGDLRAGHLANANFTACATGSETLSGVKRHAGRAAQNQEDGAMAEVEIGTVTHYFSKIGVAAITVTQDALRVGDTIHIKGHTSDFTQKIDSLQLDNRAVQEAKPGDSVGFKVVDHARQHDKVYKVVA